MPFLNEFTQAITYDVVTFAGFAVPVFLGLFALGTLILSRGK